MAIIYKISTEQEWSAARDNGVYSGSPDDLRDGFIHLSTKSQVDGTLKKHFAGKRSLLLLAVETEKLRSENLKWEISRDNEKFPHLYGDLHLDAVTEIVRIPDDR